MYAILKVNTVIFYVNCTGATLQITYIFIFYTYTKSKVSYDSVLSVLSTKLNRVWGICHSLVRMERSMLILGVVSQM